jgi:hypothetical protein
MQGYNSLAIPFAAGLRALAHTAYCLSLGERSHVDTGEAVGGGKVFLDKEPRWQSNPIRGHGSRLIEAVPGGTALDPATHSIQCSDFEVTIVQANLAKGSSLTNNDAGGSLRNRRGPIRPKDERGHRAD